MEYPHCNVVWAENGIMLDFNLHMTKYEKRIFRPYRKFNVYLQYLFK